MAPPCSMDPRALGAECDRCPLGPHAPFRSRTGAAGDAEVWRPVLGEGDSPILIVGPAPSREDVVTRRPLSGPVGIEVLRAVKQYPDATRSTVSWDNVIACAPPGFDWARFDLQLKAHNRKRARKGQEPLPSPIDCCAPRLRRALSRAETIIPLGSVPYKAVTGSSASLFDVRGTISEASIATIEHGEPVQRIIKLAPTVGNFLHRRRWLSIMRLDVVRALAWAHGQLQWTDPHITITMDPKRIKAWFDERRALAAQTGTPTRLVYDLETDGVYARTTGVRCIGFADEHNALVVPINDIDGTALWSEGHERFVCAYLLDQLQDVTAFEWWGHNADYFDRIVVESWTTRVLGKRRSPALAHDTVAVASIIMPEHPKTLAFCATVHSAEGTPAWKADHTAVTARTMAELGGYCGMDCTINRRIGPGMLERVAATGQEKAYTVLRGMQRVCAGFHQAGVPVDVDRQRRMLRWVQAAERMHEHRARKVLAETGENPEGFGRPKRKNDPCLFNPNSPDHLRELLFVRWGFMPPAALPAKDCFTDGGEFSVSKKVLIALQYDAQASDAHRAFLRALLVYKRWSKRRSTVQGLGIRHWEGATYAGAVGASRVLVPGKYVTKHRSDGSTLQVPKIIGHVDPRDGRVHASWNAHGTNVSRVSCSSPNLVNVDKSLRILFRAPPGYRFVGADWSALHFRLMAAFWKIPRLIEACVPSAQYPEGKDAHALLAAAIFGDVFWKAPGHPDPSRPGLIGDYKGPAKKMRTPIKAFGYSMGYDASPPTIYRVMASQMNDDGSRAFPDITPALVEGFHERTMEREPEWRQNWTRTRNYWRDHGYLAEPINGRRCWFEDGVVLDGVFADDDDEDDQILGNVGNQIPNFEILGAEGAFASNCTLDFVEAVPFDYAGPGTGLVHQNYDSFLALVPEHDVERVKRIMHETMNRTVGGIPMIAGVQDGESWYDVC
jgi:uracil-DNA glycosylase